MFIPCILQRSVKFKGDLWEAHTLYKEGKHMGKEQEKPGDVREMSPPPFQLRCLHLKMKSVTSPALGAFRLYDDKKEQTEGLAVAVNGEELCSPGQPPLGAPWTRERPCPFTPTAATS